MKIKMLAPGRFHFILSCFKFMFSGKEIRFLHCLLTRRAASAKCKMPTFKECQQKIEKNVGEFSKTLILNFVRRRV